jgi:hypothetical protein
MDIGGGVWFWCLTNRRQRLCQRNSPCTVSGSGFRDYRSCCSLIAPPQIALHPLQAGETRKLSLGDLTHVIHVSWFPEGNALLLIGGAEAQSLRTYKIDVNTQELEALGPTDFTGVAVSGDGRRIAGQATGRPCWIWTPIRSNTFPTCRRVAV